MRNTERKNKKIIAVIIFALLIAFLVSAGTIAWLTRKSSVTNTFTVGSFEVPTTSPTGDPISLDGNIYEPSWNLEEEHKLIPSATFDKDPYIGIGEGSEDAVVYVYIKNNMSNKVYFTINEGWEAVENETTAGSQEGTYTSGLFKYTAGLSGATDADVWTTNPIFSQVVTADDATVEDFTPADGDSEITVSCFLHQAKDSEGVAISEDTIKEAAKTAFEIQ